MSTPALPRINRRDQQVWQREARAFLRGKTAEEITRIHEHLAEFHIVDAMMDHITTAMRSIFDDDYDRKVEVVTALLESSTQGMKEEAFWIIHKEIFVDPWAADIAWNRLLSDPDDDVFKRMYELLLDEFQSASDEPLEYFIFAAERLAIAKVRSEQA